MNLGSHNGFEVPFRCYETTDSSNSYKYVGSSIFNLIGKKEPDQTKSLGFVLARSRPAMEAFLKLIIKSKKKREHLLSEQYAIDCELRLPNNKSYDRADIVIRFPDYTILVEAKSLNASVSATAAIQQGGSYIGRVSDVDTLVVSLTTNIEYGNTGVGVSITWNDIVGIFDRLIKKNVAGWLEKDFLNYIIRIKGIMNYYDVEVLSIPAGNSIKLVEECGIYECPVEGKQFSRRGEHRPLFMAFRGSDRGSVKKLYKVQDLFAMPLAGATYEAAKKSLSPDILRRIEHYKQHSFYQQTNEIVKWVFVIDLNNAITLPNEVIYELNNTFVETTRPLSAYFASPVDIDGKKVVYFRKR